MNHAKVVMAYFLTQASLKIYKEEKALGFFKSLLAKKRA